MSTAKDFPLNPADGSVVELDKGDGTTVVYRWNAANGAWEVVGKNGGTKEFITTIDVQTTADPPAKPAGFVKLTSTDDIQYLSNQKLVNWFFAEQIISNSNKIDYHLWVGDGTNPPPTLPDGSTSIFWWRPDEEELYYWSEDEQKWLLTGLQEFDRGVIMSPTAPTKHPKFLGTNNEELIDGDIWCDNSNPIEYILYIYDYTNLRWVAAGKPDRPPIFSPDEPDVHPDFPAGSNDLEAGDLWYDTTDPDEIVSYIYDGTKWIKVGGDYVHRKGGDSMEGPLKVTGDRTPNADGIVSTVQTLNVDSGQSSNLELRHNGVSKVYVGADQTSFQHHIKFAQNGKQVYAGDDNNKNGLAFYPNGVQYAGGYTTDKHVATKKNVEEAIYHDRTDPDTNKYVDRSGDSMTGELQFTGIGDGKNIIQADRGPGEFPVLLNLNHNNTVGATLGGYDIKIGGSTSYNQLRFTGQDTYLTISGGGGSNTPVKFHKDVDCGNIRFTKLGTAINDTDAVNYGQVKQELQEFKENVISDLSFGTWQYASGSVHPVSGRCFFRNQSNQNSGIFANQVTQMVFNEVDYMGAVGAFDRIDVGEIISLTNGDTTLKYKVNSAAAISGQSDEVRSFEVLYLSQSSPITFVDGIAWTFTLTEFTDISVDQLDDTYLRLDCANDPLETELTIQTPDFGEAALSLIGKRDNTNNSTATIGFHSQFDPSMQYSGYLTYRTTGQANDGFFRFNRDVDISSRGLQNASYVQFIDNGLIKHNNNDRIKFQNRGTSNDGDGLIQFERPTSNGRRGVTIRGTDKAGDEMDIFWSYTNAGDDDAVNYNGKMTGDTNLVNKKYVDDAVGSAGSGLPSGGSDGQVLKIRRSDSTAAWQGVVDIGTSGNGRAIGEMWYNNNDGTLYLRVS
jgi:hypothetical protein